MMIARARTAVAERENVASNACTSARVRSSTLRFGLLGALFAVIAARNEELIGLGVVSGILEVPGELTGGRHRMLLTVAVIFSAADAFALGLRIGVVAAGAALADLLIVAIIDREDSRHCRDLSWESGEGPRAFAIRS